ncbi:hypothetical protein BT69DRAFT_1188212, partial [Atractiella rhizophila]
SFSENVSTVEDIFSVARGQRNASISAANVAFRTPSELRIDPQFRGKMVLPALMKIPDSDFAFVKDTPSQFGFRKFNPNLREQPFSVHNSAHRFIFLTIMKALIAGNAFFALAPNRDILGNHSFLLAAYHSFVHTCLTHVFFKEQAAAGSIAADVAADTIRKRRNQVRSLLLS